MIKSQPSVAPNATKCTVEICMFAPVGGHHPLKGKFDEISQCFIKFQKRETFDLKYEISVMLSMVHNPSTSLWRSSPLHFVLGMRNPHPTTPFTRTSARDTAGIERTNEIPPSRSLSSSPLEGTRLRSVCLGYPASA